LPDRTHAVVWDLDGVIVDSAEAHNASWVAMAAEFGVPYNPDTDFKGIFGRHNSDIISQLWGVTDPEQIARMAESKESHFRQAAVRLKPLPGVVELLDAVARAGWRNAIGSSAPMANIQVLLKATGLADYFQAIASGEDVTKGKPNPKVFLVAFQRLGVDPAYGVVIEDAPAGIQAGKRAGAATLGVTTTQTRETLSEAGADRVVDTLEGVSVDDLEALVHANNGK
jgi:HAD superfamily hydrolase (TIGR01509 family)